MRGTRVQSDSGHVSQGLFRHQAEPRDQPLTRRMGPGKAGSAPLGTELVAARAANRAQCSSPQAD